MHKIRRNEPDGEDDPSCGESDDEDARQSGNGLKSTRDRNRDELKGSTSGTISQKSDSKGNQGISAMINAFQDMLKYFGGSQNDLDATIEAFETIAEMCDEVLDHQKQEATPDMLKRPSFRMYSTRKKEVRDYEHGINTLRSILSSKEM